MGEGEKNRENCQEGERGKHRRENGEIQKL